MIKKKTYFFYTFILSFCFFFVSPLSHAIDNSSSEVEINQKKRLLDFFKFVSHQRIINGDYGFKWPMVHSVIKFLAPYNVFHNILGTEVYSKELSAINSYPIELDTGFIMPLGDHYLSLYDQLGFALSSFQETLDPAWISGVRNLYEFLSKKILLNVMLDALSVDYHDEIDVSFQSAPKATLVLALSIFHGSGTKGWAVEDEDPVFKRAEFQIYKPQGIYRHQSFLIEHPRTFGREYLQRQMLKLRDMHLKSFSPVFHENFQAAISAINSSLSELSDVQISPVFLNTSTLQAFDAYKTVRYKIYYPVNWIGELLEGHHLFNSVQEQYKNIFVKGELATAQNPYYNKEIFLSAISAFQETLSQFPKNLKAFEQLENSLNNAQQLISQLTPDEYSSFLNALYASRH